MNNIKKKVKNLLSFFVFLTITFFVLSFTNASEKETVKAQGYQFHKEIIISDSDSDYYSFEIDNDIKSYGKNILLQNENKKEVPYYVTFRYGEEKCKSGYVPYNKIYQKKIGNSIEVLLDFEKPTKVPSEIEMTASEQGSKFRASYEVFGSDLKNSKYTKINTYNGKYGRDFDIIDLYIYQEDFIKISQKYRYIKIIFKLDEGKIGDLKFTKTVDNCSIVGGDFETIKPEIISEAKNENNREIILDVGKKNLEIDKIIFKNNNEKFSQRKISIFGANNKEASHYKNSKRYDKSKNYWEALNNSIFYDSNNISSWEIALNNSKYKYYKVILSGGEKAIDFNIEFQFYKNFLIFKNNNFKKGERLDIFYGNNKDNQTRYNDLKKEIENLRFINSGKRKYNDIVSNSTELKAGPKKENNKFQKVKKLTKTETNILIYLAVFLVLAFLGGYLWKVFRDVEEHKK